MSSDNDNKGYATVSSSQLLNLPCYSIHALYHGYGKTGHASLDHLNPVGYLILACAVASAEIALFVEAWSLQFDHALFRNLPCVQQLLILNTLFLWLQPTDSDKQVL
jgi:hypothetical protein